MLSVAEEDPKALTSSEVEILALVLSVNKKVMIKNASVVSSRARNVTLGAIGSKVFILLVMQPLFKYAIYDSLPVSQSSPGVHYLSE